MRDSTFFGLFAFDSLPLIPVPPPHLACGGSLLPVSTCRCGQLLLFFSRGYSILVTGFRDHQKKTLRQQPEVLCLPATRNCKTRAGKALEYAWACGLSNSRLLTPPSFSAAVTPGPSPLIPSLRVESPQGLVKVFSVIRVGTATCAVMFYK